MSANEKRTLGDLMRDTMQDKNISGADLCHGLCSPSVLSKYLNGERRMDRLLLVALLQRMGLSPDKFVTLLSDSEYDYFDWRQRLAMALLDHEWQRVSDLLEEAVALEPACNQAVREQFWEMIRIRTKAELSDEKEDRAKSYSGLLQKTVKGFPGEMGVHTYLSMQEVSCILLWQDALEDRGEAAGVLAFLEEYVRTRYSEERERVKLYPKVVARYLPILCEQDKFYECMALAGQAIKMMTVSGYASSMGAILESYVQAAEKLRLREQAHREQVWLEAWRELMREIGQGKEDPDDELYMMDVWQEAELLDEVLSRLAYSEEGIRLCRVSGTWKMLPLFVNNKADALEHLKQEKTSLQYYRLAFYCAELFKKEVSAQVAKRSYEKLLGRPTKWY